MGHYMTHPMTQVPPHHVIIDFLHHATSIAERRAADAVSLSVGDIQLLRAVERVGVIGGIAEIEKYTAQNHSTVIMALKRLEHTGLVSRMPFEEKALDGNVMKGKRTTCLILTEKGRSSIQQFRAREKVERDYAFAKAGIDPVKLFVEPDKMVLALVSVENASYNDRPSKQELVDNRAINVAEREAASKKSTKKGASK